jgi:hypothetical protein
MRREICIVLLFVTGCAGRRWAQTPVEPSSLEAHSGARTRLVTTESPGVVQKGILLHGDAKSLTLLAVDGSEQTFAISSLTRLELALERKRHLWTGVLVGAAAGVGLGMAFPIDPQDCGTWSGNFCSQGDAVASGVLVGAIVGGCIGAAIHGDRWTPVALGARKSAAFHGSGHPGPVAFAIAFRF